MHCAARYGRGLSLLAFAATLLAASVAHADSDERTCTGVDFDRSRAVVVSKIVAKPRVNFIKSAWEDTACPADTDACRRKAYLVPRDLVLTGRRFDAYTCIAYQSPLARKQDWSNGWMPTSALTPVAPSPAPKLSDWIGVWEHPGGDVTIKREDGKLAITGLQTYPAAQNFHTGVLEANNVVPINDTTILFADDNSEPAAEASDGGCIVRLQRFGRWLLAEDNGGCGGVMVTFTGLYRRSK